jgi:3-hydroxyacyl-[acyl-carrier-protein] dehydratase
MNKSECLYNYRLIDTKSDANDYSFEICIDEEHPVFKGHFPSQPVMPGVYVIDMTEKCTSSAFGKNLKMSNIESVKFLRPIIPNMHKRFILSLLLKDIDETSYKISAHITIDNQIHVKLKGELKVVGHEVI